MQWYYADGDERIGPVVETEIQALIATGKIRTDTLVWHAKLDGWKTAVSVGLFGEEQAAAARVASSVSSVIDPASDAPNVMRQGSKIVIPKHGAIFPARCVKTNEPVAEEDVKKETYYRCARWVALWILLSLLVTIILYLVLRKKVPVNVPISAVGRASVRKHKRNIIALLVFGIALVVVDFSIPKAMGWSALGLLIVLGSLIYAGVRGTALRIVKMEENHVWLKGACPAFLETLPPYQRER